MNRPISPLQRARIDFAAKLPAVFTEHGAHVAADVAATVPLVADQKGIPEQFPHTGGLPFVAFRGGDTTDRSALNVAVILSGGQAPGGHNVIAGLFDGLKSLSVDSRLYGFKGGPDGLVANDYVELTAKFVDAYRNTGGFDMIGSGRGKLEDEDQYRKVRSNCEALGITGIVVIGGDDSNTNACVLAEFFCKDDAGISVIGCPKTIDGDLKNGAIETSFGFDTACKEYSDVIGNVARDAASARKYWHFIKLMGRSASHITLECALQTQVNIALISEEVENRDQTLDDVVTEITQVIVKRSEQGRNYGVALVPEGLIEFIPEIKILIRELNDLLAATPVSLARDLAASESVDALGQLGLTPSSAAVYRSLPDSIRQQLVKDRDPHGNVHVSSIETEKLLIEMVGARLTSMKAAGEYGGKYATQHHFFGYEGRCAMPSNFDANYSYSLGYSAAALLGTGKTGYISCVRNLTAPPEQWQPGGVPATAMMNIEQRKGKAVPVIQKALVELDGAPFKAFSKQRENWSIDDCYLFPGAIQYFGPADLCDATPHTLALEQQ
jgi:pyrophosphate--fructose-6-phosphate 1-phosphotransferase